MMLGCKGLRILRIHETKRYKKNLKTRQNKHRHLFCASSRAASLNFNRRNLPGGWGGGGERRVGRGSVEYGGGLLFYFLIFLCYRYHYYFWMLCYKVSLVKIYEFIYEN